MTIGADNLVYAIMTDEAAETYGVVKPCKKLKELDVNPSTWEVTDEYDDGIGEVITGMDEIAVTINVADLEDSVQADWFGHTIDAKGVLIKKTSDKSKYVAIGFRSLMADQVNYRYKWLFKAKFKPSQETSKTKKKGGPEFQAKTVTGIAVRRNRDSSWEASVDSNKAEIDETVIADWFKAPYGETIPA